MIIAIASGKGGTGKTTLAVNLAVVAAREKREVTYIDCDVEEPNGHIFLNPDIESTTKVTMPVPLVDESKCTYCGKCSRICQFSAIAVMRNNILLFPELCHGCGGCFLVCDEGAIVESERELGRTEAGTVTLPASGETGNRDRLKFIQGVLNVGEAMSPPVIRKVKRIVPESGLRIIDAPPGNSCPTVESVKGADYAVLVTEPTPFGLYDLEIAIDTMNQLGLPAGVVINRSNIGDDRVRRFCIERSIEILAEIPEDREIAEVYSRGLIVSEELPRFRDRIRELLIRLGIEVERYSSV